MMHQYMMRANLSVAMVVMVDAKQMMHSKNRTVPDCGGQVPPVVVASDEDTNFTDLNEEVSSFTRGRTLNFVTTYSVEIASN